MKSSWREVYLEDVANELTVGYVGSMTSEYVDSGIPFLRSLNVEPFEINVKELKYISSEFHKKINKSRLQPGDVVIVRTGRPGACTVIPNWLSEANCSDLVIIRPGNNIDPYFLAAYINTAATQYVYSHLVGAVQQHFNVGSARKLKILLPPLNEQKAIVKIVKDLNDKMDTNKSIIKTLEQLAQTLFKRWFIDFEFPNEDGEPYRSTGGKMVESEMGLVPDGWTVSNINKIAKLVGKNIDVGSLNESTHYIGLEHMPRGSIALSSWETSEKISSNKTQFNKGDILFGKLRPYFKKVGIAQLSGVCSTDILVLNSIREEFFSFLVCLVSQDKFIDYCSATATGTRMPRTGWKQMSSYKMIMPPIKLVSKFNEVLNPLFEQISHLIDNTRSLHELRDGILPMLISGEIEIPIESGELDYV